MAFAAVAQASVQVEDFIGRPIRHADLHAVIPPEHVCHLSPRDFLADLCDNSPKTSTIAPYISSQVTSQTPLTTSTEPRLETGFVSSLDNYDKIIQILPTTVHEVWTTSYYKKNTSTTPRTTIDITHVY